MLILWFTNINLNYLFIFVPEYFLKKCKNNIWIRKKYIATKQGVKAQLNGFYNWKCGKNRLYKYLQTVFTGQTDSTFNLDHTFIQIKWSNIHLDKSVMVFDV